jgi:Zn-dependent protease
MLNVAPAELIARIITLVIALTVHEFAHALTADYFGDMTPRQAGQLTLNPLVHLDFFGSLMLVVTGFGWAKPTPINPYVLKQHSRFAIIWVSLAGPISNLLLAALAALPLRFGLVQVTTTTGLLPSLGELIYVFFYINLILAIFNLIPIPPLDGEKILSTLLPDSVAATYDKIRPYGPFVLMILIFFGPTIHFDLIGWIMTPILTALSKVLL